MANPQQPELRRSETIPSLTPDAVEGDLRGRSQPGRKGETGPVPKGNKPHRGDATSDSDKPDLDKFAAKLGIDEPDPDGERAAEAAAESVDARSQGAEGLLGTARTVVGQTSKVALGAVGLGVGAAAWAGSRVVDRVRNR